VRSYRERGGAWFPLRTAASRAPHPAGGLERNAASEEPDDSVHPAIDRAYRTKYGGHSDAYVLPMITPDATPKCGSGPSWPDRHRRIERRGGSPSASSSLPIVSTSHGPSGRSSRAHSATKTGNKVPAWVSSMHLRPSGHSRFA
jgi:hypothetical protein